MNKKGLNLASPWAIFYHEVQALFEKDENIKIIFDEENYVIKLYVTGTDKAVALEKLLPQEKDFGNITLKELLLEIQFFLMLQTDIMVLPQIILMLYLEKKQFNIIMIH